MTLAVEAVFENGVLKPLNPLNLPEHQKVRLVLDTAVSPSPDAPKQWHWKEAQAIDDHFAGDASEELVRQRREG
jgi:predicted DNA-binding antitoxin AbrB/MazE fold protein